MLISPAYAQGLLGSFGDSSGLLQGILPLVLVLVVFYFLVLRPQQQKTKEHRAMLTALRRGDRVATGGGIIGTVAKVVSNDEVMVDIADGVRVRILRATIASVLAKTEPVAAKGDKDKDRDRDEEKEPEKVEAEGGDKAKGTQRRAAGGK